jgi:hypothetical protein
MVPVIKNAENLLKMAKEIESREGINGRLFPWGHKHLSVTFCRMKNQLKNEQMNGRFNNAPKIEEIADPQNVTNKREELRNYFRLYDLRHTAITELYLHPYWQIYNPATLSKRPLYSRGERLAY